MGDEDGPDPARGAVLYANEFRIDTIIMEGPDIGRHCVTIRVSGCNLSCEACDRPGTWGPHVISRPVRVGALLDRIEQMDRIFPISRVVITGGEPLMQVGALLDRIEQMDRIFPISRVVITGGEPLMQQDGMALRCLIEECIDVGRTVYIETNGTIIPCPWLKAISEYDWIRWRVSPKVCGPLATDPTRSRIYPAALRWFADNPRAEFLFPCAETTEIDVIYAFCVDHQLNPGRVWIYPLVTENTDVVRLGRLLAPAILRAGFNVSTHLGVIMMVG